MNDLQARIERERDTFDNGLKRDSYDRVLAHCHGPWLAPRREMFRRHLFAPDTARALELGSHGWAQLVTPEDRLPGELHCINISQRELDKGREKAAARGQDVRFHLMDAHSLDFPDNSFDVVFGFGILHHLDYETALDEVRRVLRPGGRMVFYEPLDVNPVGRIVRAMTPQARTPDEAPLRVKHLKFFTDRFETRYTTEQFLSVPAGVLSGRLFASPDNAMMRAAFGLDRLLARVPGLRLWFRYLIVEGVKPADAAERTAPPLAAE